jgi:hypothetical protein
MYGRQMSAGGCGARTHSGTRDHQAKSGVYPSEVRHSKANDLVQEELMSLYGVLQPRMNIVLIMTCWRAYAIEKSIAKGAPRLLVPETKATIARITSTSLGAVSGGTMHDDLIG